MIGHIILVIKGLCTVDTTYALTSAVHYNYMLLHIAFIAGGFAANCAFVFLVALRIGDEL